MRPHTLFLVVSCMLTHALMAAPMTLKELEFLIRQRTPDDAIVQEAAQRRLVAPINAEVEQVLKANGATDGLLARLKAPAMALSPEESRAEFNRVMTQQSRATQSAAEDVAAKDALERQRTEIATKMKGATTVRQFLEGRLVKLDGDQVKNFEARELERVRLFAFYFATVSAAPCRKFTPELVEAYKELKAKYPDFELIFVSKDRDEFNMGEHMRNYRMPWPAVRFGADHEGIEQFGGDGVPWLVAFSDSGQPLTTNGRDKQFVQPAEILEAIRYILANIPLNR